MTFILGMILGGFLGIGCVALVNGNSYDDGFRNGYITALQEVRNDRQRQSDPESE